MSCPCLSPLANPSVWSWPRCHFGTGSVLSFSSPERPVRPGRLYHLRLFEIRQEELMEIKKQCFYTA